MQAQRQVVAFCCESHIGQISNRSILERHRMIYQAVDDLMPSEIHALSIQALTPEEQ